MSSTVFGSRSTTPNRHTRSHHAATRSISRGSSKLPSAAVRSNQQGSSRNSYGTGTSDSYNSTSRPDTAATSITTSTRPETRRSRPGTSRSRPGTSRSTNADTSDGYYVLAISEGRGVASEVGIAAIDLHSNECLLFQVADSQTYLKTLHTIYLTSPAEILLSFSALEPTRSKLAQAISDAFPLISLVPVSRKHFNDNTGMHLIRHLGFSDTDDAAEDNGGEGTLLMALANKYYCLAATAALFNYIERVEGLVFASNTVRFLFQAPDGSMIIDFFTARSLELVANLTDIKSNHNLFGVINKTGTPMGARLLRMNILQPLNDLATIETRLDAVEELCQSEEMFFALQTAFVKSRLLTTIKLTVSDEKLSELEDIIAEVINDDVTFQKSAMGLRNQRCYAVKAGFNGLLDVARQTYKETTNDVYNLVSQLSETHNIPLKLSYNPSSGFTLSLPSEQIPGTTLPKDFVNVVKKGKKVTCTTLQLMGLNERVKESLLEVYLMSDRIIQVLLDRIHGFIPTLSRVSTSIGLLDMIASFTHLCTTQNCVRPEFTETLAIKGGRCPIKSVIKGESMEVEWVPNDIYAGEGSGVQVIMGPNMSGKSTYLRLPALLTLLAQIGCFVPAEYASIRLCDRIFSRIGCDDPLEANTSTFMHEMCETAFILQNLTPKSVVLIDELGRGTSTTDAMSLTFAVLSYLAKHKSFVFFATHFHSIFQLLRSTPNIVGLSLQVHQPPSTPYYVPLYTLTTSSDNPPVEHYGIKLAHLAGLPTALLERSEDLSKLLKRRLSEREAPQDNSIDIYRELASKLLTLHTSSTLPEPELRKLLKELQDKYRVRLGGGDESEAEQDLLNAS
ncbi:muts domain V-domain-containing protein [Gaertneriomyces semiglobifer]|nr:muts domain V-domain-containing protein [Gaertneriomyces semiglobifer]